MPGDAQAPWRDIFWGVWALVHVLYCHHCLQYFPASDLAQCSFHPEAPMFLAGRSSGRWAAAVRRVPVGDTLCSYCWLALESEQSL